ncbi:MAG: nucleotide exchange factor GrpE [Chlamydiae bacterium GWC2_50_10]|nr:MAG: nucleotide exchange factor GrpE [Chlamydiae bacterium GWA2_50_15]OGN54805.1 MAG: nucleotide exchange factor GrpE [Chlamydiae bacterium GWC2_50_10]OGN55434.1 MAG: nucleotide exchange factor GrpE [Chlamydiae bacterium GWF2_49_8]OGN58628.1 MAG: nucleotide exchange factor GrpE [Chlamydiae bacterium RIFCSPHIGHO2_02_FULL_49_29]OGN63836.1 MAG: nucleotide exchange factor GrpE [Chlamydiae bacterium RIFCSPHIGHO2_12_FULL_49_32]OGN70269.1 MAG: nucleotide exchange factor GrpE [Chlamydiae bacterium 
MTQTDEKEGIPPEAQEERPSPLPENPSDHLRELKEQKEKNLLLLADMENLRKRLYKEKLEMNRFAQENLLAEILMPLDNFENALGFAEKMSSEIQNWAKGFEMILGQFKEILHRYQVTAFHSTGEQFDPNRHEAVEVEERQDVPEGTVSHEFLKGYQSQGRVLRPARVKVAKRPAPKIHQEQQEQKKE